MDTEAGLAGAIAHVGAKAFKSAALDNSREFAKASAALGGFGIDAYFCHLYSSWDKGSVERHNGIARLYVPKGAKNKPNER
ncbi:MAG: hypothetical protein FWG10_13370 [Eubacteriaceae bacterium]|nr:hypothetical protein [Eubacteriaceae bacterium]